VQNHPGQRQHTHRERVRGHLDRGGPAGGNRIDSGGDKHHHHHRSALRRSCRRARFTNGLNQGSYPGAYGALIKGINNSGGINGRKIKPVYVAVNPIGSDSATATCAQLTEDDQVFAVIGFLQNNDSVWYTNLHHTPIGRGLEPETASASHPYNRGSPSRDSRRWGPAGPLTLAA
jgi:hypothetical protein